MKAKFHLSLPTGDIENTKEFYTNVLGCKIGRQENGWFDVNVFGNQITFTANNQFAIESDNYQFDDETLPTFHFGVVLEDADWNSTYDKLKKIEKVDVEPIKFLVNKTGEHESFFIIDPNGYYLEFKKFRNTEDIFS